MSENQSEEEKVGIIAKIKGLFAKSDEEPIPNDQLPGPKEHYGLEGKKKFFQKHIFDLGMCFDKRVKDSWALHICKVPCLAPQYYLAGCLAPCCMAFNQREFLLAGKMYDEYSCCQGKYGKCWCTPIARKIPHCCLVAEVICCTGCAISGNRFELGERYMKKDSLTETIILLLASILSFLGMFGYILGCWVNGVLNGQHEKAIIDGEGQTGLHPYTMWKNDNNCWEFWKCEPCCGEPCNFMDGLKCAAFWLLPCFSLCTISKFYATSLGEDCTVLDHFLPWLLALLCNMFTPIPVFHVVPCILLNAAVRHNYRIQDGAGDTRWLFGDCLLSFLCGPFAICQELRASPKESWDWYHQFQEKSIDIGMFNILIFKDERDVAKENYAVRKKNDNAPEDSEGNPEF